MRLSNGYCILGVEKEKGKKLAPASWRQRGKGGTPCSRTRKLSEQRGGVGEGCVFSVGGVFIDFESFHTTGVCVRDRSSKSVPDKWAITARSGSA